MNLLKKDWKNGDVIIFLFAIIVAMTAASSIYFFSDRVKRAMTAYTVEALGGDRVIIGSTPIPETWITQAKKNHLRFSLTQQFFTMVGFNDRVELASVKAVSGAYPLKGELKTSDGIAGIPKSHEIWVDSSLRYILHLQQGDFVSMGDSRFQVTHFIESDPVKNRDGFSFYPRLLMNTDDLAATHILQPGSRAQYTLALAGSEDTLIRFIQQLNPPVNASQKILSPASEKNDIQRNLNRIENYLHLANMLSVILAGVAVKIAISRYIRRHTHTVALLRCFGLPRHRLLLIYFSHILFLSLIGMAIGCLLGWLGQWLLQYYFATWLHVTLPQPHFKPIFSSITSVGIIIITFALPWLLGISRVCGIDLLREKKNLVLEEGWLLYLGAGVGIFSLLLHQTQNVVLVTLIFSGSLLVITLLYSMLSLVIFGLHRLRSHLPLLLKLALSNIGRKGYGSYTLLIALSLPITLLLLLSLLQKNLFSEWQTKIKPNTPNYFAINIDQNEKPAFQAFIEQSHLSATDFYPVIRGRLVAKNNIPILKAIPNYAQSNNALHRDLNLTFTTRLPENNTIVKGSWLNDKKESLSIVDTLAKELAIHIGDRLSFAIADQTVTATVSSFRSVEWQSFHPNFFIIFSPDVLANIPNTFMTSFYLPDSALPLLPVFRERFPAVSLIDVKSIIQEIQQFFDQGALLLNYLFSFALLAGIVILFAVIESGMNLRAHDFNLLHRLGVSRLRIQTLWQIEFALVGLLAGSMASLIAALSGMALSHYTFDLPLTLPTWLFIAGPLAGLGISLFAALPLARR